MKLTESAASFPVTAQLPGEDGYSGGKVIFIDTENTLYPHKIRPEPSTVERNQPAHNVDAHSCAVRPVTAIIIVLDRVPVVRTD